MVRWPGIEAELTMVENAAAILSVRNRGADGMLPGELAKFTDGQIAAALIQAAARILDRIREAEGDPS